jgi:hypothetical protein
MNKVAVPTSDFFLPDKSEHPSPVLTYIDYCLGKVSRSMIWVQGALLGAYVYAQYVSQSQDSLSDNVQTTVFSEADR